MYVKMQDANITKRPEYMDRTQPDNTLRWPIPFSVYSAPSYSVVYDFVYFCIGQDQATHLRQSGDFG